MPSPHIPPPHNAAHTHPTASAPSTGQAAGSAPAPITDLNRQFVLTFGGTPGQPASAIGTFDVPPRMRTNDNDNDNANANAMPDAQVIQVLFDMARNPDRGRWT